MNKLKQLSILLIEDDEDDYFITKKYIKDIPDTEITLDWISSFAEAKQALLTSQHDACLIDYRLGENTGIELLQYAREIKYRTPTIILTGQADHETDLEATEAGASDYLVKAELNSRQLERTFRYTIKMTQTMERLRQARDNLEAEVEVRKQKEAELITAMKVAETATQAKAEFLSNMSHEMRTPMHAILGYAELGHLDIDNSKEKYAEYFTHITNSGQRLLELITTLLNLTELDAGHIEFDMQEADLMEIIKATTADYAAPLQDKLLTIKINAENRCHIAQFDAIQIMQVTNCMLHNAIRYTPNERQLTFTVAPDELQDSAEDTVSAITFSISDQGIGIPEDELEGIFDAFVQSTKTKTGAGGTGLGLNVCKKIIEGHQGKIWAENNAQGGATFSFTIPLIQTAADNS